ncbi:MAG: tetratricopeptide repeat protein [Chloroflexi bacterium]|nr:tetratricopeptide repeat protein [Chloroflexota bacterium]
MAKKKSAKEEIKSNVSIGGGVNDGVIIDGNGNIVTINKMPESRFSHLHQLYAPPADFTGREAELGILLQKIRKGGVAISGLHGMGGIGKTALALKLADLLKEQYPDAQFFLDLHGVDKDQQEPLTPAQAMAHVILNLQPGEKLSDEKGQPFDEERVGVVYRSVLYGKRAILLWDNARDADQIKPLLVQNCLTLVTSRQHFVLPGLDAITLETLSEEDSRSLVMKIAPRLTTKDADEISRLCGYLPLALRTAASALDNRPDLSPADYIQRLKDAQTRLGLVEASFQTSYDLLNETAQMRFQQLGVFSSSFGREALQAIWQTETEETDQTIAQLLQDSLLDYDTDISRYILHDMLKIFARAKLHKSAEETNTFILLSSWLADLFNANYKVDPQNAPEIQFEMDNLRFAIEWAIANKKSNILADLSTAPRNWLFNFFRNWDEWLGWLHAALDLGIENNKLKANVLQAIGDVQQFRKQMDAALASYNEALKLFKAVGDHLGEANVLQAIGDVQQFRKQMDAALASYNEALKLFKAVGDHLGEANVLSELAKLALISGDIASAERQTEEVAAIYLGINAIYSMGACYGNFSIALLNLGNKAKAKGYALKARQAFEKVGEPAILKQVDSLIAACKE